MSTTVYVYSLAISTYSTPTAVYVGNPAAGREIFTPERATCVIFFFLPSSSGRFSVRYIDSSSRLTAGCSFLTPKRSKYLPIVHSCLWWLFLAVFFPPKGLLLPLYPSLLLQKCYQPLTSPQSLQKLRTDNLCLLKYMYSEIGLRRIPPREDNQFFKKPKEKKKKTWPRCQNPSKCIHVSLAGEKSTPAVTASVFHSLNTRPINVYTPIHTNIHLHISPLWIQGG